jgi:hypothetical protein
MTFVERWLLRKPHRSAKSSSMITANRNSAVVQALANIDIRAALRHHTMVIR